MRVWWGAEAGEGVGGSKGSTEGHGGAGEPVQSLRRLSSPAPPPFPSLHAEGRDRVGLREVQLQQRREHPPPGQGRPPPSPQTWRWPCPTASAPIPAPAPSLAPAPAPAPHGPSLAPAPGALGPVRARCTKTVDNCSIAAGSGRDGIAQGGGEGRLHHPRTPR